MGSIKKLTKCRICRNGKLYKFLDLGKMPLPNGFLKKSELSKKEKFYPLSTFLCQNCSLVQLTHVIDPKFMFNRYLYIPSGAKVMMNNFSNLAYSSYRKLNLGKKSLVIDIGSNDGSLLKFFKDLRIRVLGIDPAKNIAKIAKQGGIPTEAGLFDLKMALKLRKIYGAADLITATNVVAHIDDLDQLFGGIKFLLKEQGLFITEFPYLPDLISRNQFDTIYHEHLSYFSLKPWLKIVAKFGFQITDARKILIHGGSIRLSHRVKNDSVSHHKNVSYLLGLEEEMGLYDIKTYQFFSQKIFALKGQLTSLLTSLKSKNKKIVGLGAAAKGNVLTNFFDIGPEVLDYIADSTLLKHGLYTPGKHIPIYPEERVYTDRPDYGLILAWNFSDEIVKKYKDFQRSGGKFIIPIPEVQVI